MTAGDQHEVIAYDTTTDSVSTTWSEPANQYALAVSGGSVRIGGTYPGQTGSSYTLSGVNTGSLPSLVAPQGYFLDGTTDGTNNYSDEWGGNGAVYEFDADWGSPQLLFYQPDMYALGITYDAVNNSLWIGGRSADIVDYSMSGTVLSSFANPISGSDNTSNCCGSGLALDSEGNLWENGDSELYEFTQTGTLEGTYNTGVPPYVNVIGLEFAEGQSVTATPEPASILLLATGALGLAAAVRRRSSLSTAPR